MRNVLFKKAAIVIIAAVVMSVSAVAQKKGDMAVGGNLSLIGLGLGPKFQYNVADKFRLEGNFTYYLLFTKAFIDSDGEIDSFSWWDTTVNAHFLFPNASNKVVCYPIVGLGVNRISWVERSSYVGKIKESGSLPVVNIGCGFDFKVSEQLAINLEAKIRLMALVTAGVTYRF